MAENNDLNKEYIKELERELHDFELKSEGSNKTMQMLVYPAMFAFVILAAYGFYLIQSLSSDVHKMANTIADMTSSVETNMDTISGSMQNMTGDVNHLVSTIKSMSGDIGSMNDNTRVMVDSIGGMKSATYDMAASTNNMQRDMWSLNQNISTPLSMMNKFLPWKNNSTGPFPGSRAPLPPNYYAYPMQQAQPNLGTMPLQLPPLPVDPTALDPVPAATAQGTDDQSSLGTLPVENITGQKANYNAYNAFPATIAPTQTSNASNI